MQIKVEIKSWNLVPAFYFLCPKSDTLSQSRLDWTIPMSSLLDFLSPVYLVSLLHSSHCCWSYSLKPKSDLTTLFFFIKKEDPETPWKLEIKIKLTYLPIVYGEKKNNPNFRACLLKLPKCRSNLPFQSHLSATMKLTLQLYQSIFLWNSSFFSTDVSFAQSIPSTLNALSCLLYPLKAYLSLIGQVKHSHHKARLWRSQLEYPLLPEPCYPSQRLYFWLLQLFTYMSSKLNHKLEERNSICSFEYYLIA